MREKLQNSEFKTYKTLNSYTSTSDYKLKSLKLKLIKNINSCVSYSMSLLVVIAVIEFIRFCFDLFAYLH